MSASLGFPKRGLESQRHRMSALGARGLSLAGRKRAPGLCLYAPPPQHTPGESLCSGVWLS